MPSKLNAPPPNCSRVLVATDGSATGARAVSFAASLARTCGATLVICTAVDEATAFVPCNVDAAQADLQIAAELAARAGISCETVVLEGRAAEAIVACGSRGDFDAIVVGTMGKGALDRFVLGSTAAAVLRDSDVPTFVVPAGEAPDFPAIERIVVAVEPAGSSDAAFAFAAAFAARHEAALVVCAVVESRDLFDEAAADGYDPQPLLARRREAARATAESHDARCRERGVPSQTCVAEGEAASTIVATARSQGAQLIAMGTHGYRGLKRFFVGSVAERVVREAGVPVVIVHSRATTGGRPSILDIERTFD